MARRKLLDDLKTAIGDLSHKEKNALLFRLIAKEDILTEQLTFKLLEHSSTTKDRRQDVEDKIYELINKDRISSVQMLRNIRRLSALITRHVRVTKDKYGEIDLNLILLKQSLEYYSPKLKHSWDKQSRKIREYIFKKLKRQSILSTKIHPDYKIDFSDTLEEISVIINNDEKLSRLAIEMGVDIRLISDGNFLVSN